MIYAETTWNGFRRIDFEFAGRKAIFVFPKEKKTDRWLMKTEYFDAFPNLEIEMLNRGYSLGYIENHDRWGTAEDQAVRRDFVEFMMAEFQLNQRCFPVGMSCGGLHAMRFAELYPQHVGGLYLDAAVMNLLSTAGLGCGERNPAVWQEMVNAYGFTDSSIISFRESPIDHMDVLIQNKIPVIMLYGNADREVPYHENGKILEDYYKAEGGTMKVICKSMAGHHPHGLEDPTVIADFIEANYQ